MTPTQTSCTFYTGKSVKNITRYICCLFRVPQKGSHFMIRLARPDQAAEIFSSWPSSGSVEGEPPKKQQKIRPKTQIAKPQPLEISVKLGHLQRFFKVFFTASPSFISIIPGLWFDNSCRTSFYIKPGLLFLFPPQSSQWFGQFLLGKNQQKFKHGQNLIPVCSSHFGSLAPSFPLLLPMVFPSQILGTLVHPIGFGKLKSWLQVPPRHNLNKISSSPSNWAFPLSLEFQKKQTKLMTLPWSCFGNHWWPQQQKFPQKLCRPSIFAEDLVVESGPGKVGPAWKTERCFMTSIGTQTSAAICTHENWVLFSQHSTCELKIPNKD